MHERPGIQKQRFPQCESGSRCLFAVNGELIACPNLFMLFGTLCRGLYGAVMVAGMAMVVMRERLGDFLGGEAAVVFTM
jgi:hypothetical protein